MKILFTTFITCLVVLSFVNPLTCVIFNEITGRCLNMKSEYDSKEMRLNQSLSALPCTWDINNKSASFDEWLEIVLIPSGFGTDRNLREDFYSIRKASSDTELCIISSKTKMAVTSTFCDSKDAFFNVEAAPGSRGIQHVRTKVTIMDVDGLCLTSQPGRETVSFKQCTKHHRLFQQWLVCGHKKNCNVDVTWTPRKIDFNEVNMSSEMKPEDENRVHGKLAGTNSANVCQNQLAIQNEVLYSIQNGIEFFGKNEDFLVPTLAIFYPSVTLNEAKNIVLNICQDENLKCNLCATRSWRKLVDELATTKWLFSWMAECNTMPQERRFLSRNALQVPHYIFPLQELPSSQDFHNKRLYKTVLPNLKRYVDALENKVKEDEDEQQIGNQNHLSHLNEVKNGTKLNDKTTSKYEMSTTLSNPDVSFDIDIRILNSALNNATTNK